MPETDAAFAIHSPQLGVLCTRQQNRRNKVVVCGARTPHTPTKLSDWHFIVRSRTDEFAWSRVLQ